jgi:hypothetical protein
MGPMLARNMQEKSQNVLVLIKVHEFVFNNLYRVLTIFERKQYTVVHENRKEFSTENYFQLQCAIKDLNPYTRK